MKVVMMVVLCAALFLGSVAYAEIPALLSYQGVLTDNNGVPLPNGNYNLTLSIYNVATGGTALWSEGQLVNVTNGVFNVRLGSVTSLTVPFDEPYYLGVAVGGGSELTPRTFLAAAPYTLNAAHAVTASNAPVVAFGLSDDTTPLGATWTNYNGDSVNIVCPGPGFLVAQSTAWMYVAHAASENLLFEISHGLTSTSAPNDPAYWVATTIPTTYPVFSGTHMSFPVQTVFPITAAGPVTVYLNGQKPLGTSEVDFYYANTVVTFYPAPATAVAQHAARVPSPLKAQ